MNFRGIVVLTSMVAGLGAAGAADLAVKAPAQAPAYYDWSGIYVGANAGYGWGDTSWISATNQFFAVKPGESFSTHPKGALAGGQIGINKQVGSWVWGVEVTGDWSDMMQSVVGPFEFPTDIWTTKLKDLETLTGRLGYAANNWLFYGKAGGATGEVSAHVSTSPPNVVFGQSQRLWGVTAGGGVEYGLTPNIILGVEYDFTRLFAGQFTGTASNRDLVTFGAKSSFDVQAITGRVSYKF